MANHTKARPITYTQDATAEDCTLILDYVHLYICTPMSKQEKPLNALYSSSLTYTHTIMIWQSRSLCSTWLRYGSTSSWQHTPATFKHINITITYNNDHIYHWIDILFHTMGSHSKNMIKPNSVRLFIVFIYCRCIIFRGYLFSRSAEPKAIHGYTNSRYKHWMRHIYHTYLNSRVLIFAVITWPRKLIPSEIYYFYSTHLYDICV